MFKWLLLAVVAVLSAIGISVIVNRRIPPPDFVSIKHLSAYQDPTLISRAWSLAEARHFHAPIRSQSNPSACGPTSIANIASATPEDVASHGKGCINGFCFGGLTLEQLAAATRETQPTWKVETVHPADVEALRSELRRADQTLVVNFDRFPLFGIDGGHHSPIGAYLEAEDLVFVLDVNKSFGPWLVPTERLFEALNTVDSSSGEKRGLIRIRNN